jgi:hypothetical protein
MTYRLVRTVPTESDPLRVSSAFLEMILLHEPFRSMIPRQGVRIRGAHFNDVVDLSHATLDHDLWLNGSTFDRGLDLTDLHALGSLSFDESRVEGLLNMQGAIVDRDLFMDRVLFSGSAGVRLVELKIGRSLHLEDAEVQGDLNMDTISIQGHLFLRGIRKQAKFSNVWLQNARVGGMVYLDDCQISGELTMRGFDGGSGISIRNTSFTNVIMTNLKARGDVAIEGQPRGPDRRGVVDLRGASIAGGLVLGSAGYGPLNWPKNARLVLRDTAVFAVQDGINCQETCNGAWPIELELDGFRYEQFGGDSNSPLADMASRSSSWWVNWLAREKHVSPQPYEQLASVLTRLGYKEKARDILYASKDRERNETPYPGKALLLAQWAFIGYGYRTSRSVWWLLFFVLVGAAVLRLSREGEAHGMPIGLAYSLDLLLPVIVLRKAHHEIDLAGWARYYFYFHKAMGYVVVSFIVAGLAGLTK